MKLVKACIAMAAFAALFIVPSIASAITLETPTGTAAAIGKEIIATNVAHSTTPLTTKLTSGVGNIECETATLSGKLTANGGANVEGNITTAEFRGKPGSSPHSVACSGGFGGDTTVTPSHSSNPCHTPEGKPQHCSLPWCVKAGAEDVFTVRGGECSQAARPLTFSLHTSTLGTCAYEKASVTGTYTTHPADLVMTISNQVFKRITGSVFCPSEGVLQMAFTLNSGDGTGKEVGPEYIT